MNAGIEDATVVIVGAGPIGLELAVALKHAGIDCIQFDASNVGATIGWYPPQMQFHSRQRWRPMCQASSLPELRCRVPR